MRHLISNLLDIFQLCDYFFSLMGLKTIGEKEFQHQLATKLAEGERDMEESSWGAVKKGHPVAQYKMPF